MREKGKRKESNSETKNKTIKYNDPTALIDVDTTEVIDDNNYKLFYDSGPID